MYYRIVNDVNLIKEINARNYAILSPKCLQTLEQVDHKKSMSLGLNQIKLIFLINRK
jgi:hypothetical protein